MSGPGRFLLIGPESVGTELAAAWGLSDLTAVPEPYPAMEQLARRPWEAVIVTAPRDDLGGLTRALRRIQGDRAVLGLCAPCAEPELRAVAAETMDDYFIYPPGRSDLQRLAEVTQQSGEQASLLPAEGALAPSDFARLLRAASSVENLERQIARMLAARLGADVEWIAADDLGENMEILLFVEHPTARALVARGYRGTANRQAGPFISALQQCLGELLAAARRTQTLGRLAVTDHLTEAHNRRYLYFRADQILNRPDAESLRATLLLYDIDNFKRYNDQYGHAAGDEVLREVAKLMRRVTRSQDVVARIGGDEFAVLFWDPMPPRKAGSAPPQTPEILAERFRQLVSTHRFEALGPEAAGTLSISGGLASFPQDGQTCRQLLRTADMALKQVKRAGKNGIRIVGH